MTKKSNNVILRLNKLFCDCTEYMKLYLKSWQKFDNNATFCCSFCDCIGGMKSLQVQCCINRCSVVNVINSDNKVDTTYFHFLITHICLYTSEITSTVHLMTALMTGSGDNLESLR